ncbi:MAG: hypothetical protein LQ351_007781 [Letrouitia transgressa]|nr:MAG: hypothetical protein LQ351_007781 [Letrouitia transgressa]
MDGDHSAKTFEQGANSALKDQDLTSGIHESVNQVPSSGDKTTGTGTSVFSKDGAVGSMFNADGPLGGTAQKVGGPFDKEGAVGKHFNADGKIGGMVQQNLAEKKS